VSDKDLTETGQANSNLGIHFMFAKLQHFGVTAPGQKLDVLVDIRHKTVHFLWGVPDENRFEEFLHTIRLIL
jgi:hypothetical protein